MKAKSLAFLLPVAALVASSFAVAQPNDPPNNNPDPYGRPIKGQQLRSNDARFSGGQYNHPEAYNQRPNVYYGARGPEFRRGGYIPREYRGRQYVVNDWRAHHLSAPPRGQEWVQVGGDYVLIAVATGLIANLILNQ